jgi:hypothetical protein
MYLLFWGRTPETVHGQALYFGLMAVIVAACWSTWLGRIAAAPDRLPMSPGVYGALVAEAAIGTALSLYVLVAYRPPPEVGWWLGSVAPRALLVTGALLLGIVAWRLLVLRHVLVGPAPSEGAA